MYYVNLYPQLCCTAWLTWSLLAKHRQCSSGSVWSSICFLLFKYLALYASGPVNQYFQVVCNHYDCSPLWELMGIFIYCFCHVIQCYFWFVAAHCFFLIPSWDIVLSIQHLTFCTSHEYQNGWCVWYYPINLKSLGLIPTGAPASNFKLLT